MLIPKIYFDAYGGFNEKHRAVQDYEKWFEIFRGKRLIYLRDTLVIVRSHPQQTGRTYDKVLEEERWLYNWMAQNVEFDDLVGSGFTDMYHFFSAVFSRWLRHHSGEAIYALQKLKELPESPDIEERIRRFVNFLNHPEYDTYFLKENLSVIQQAFFFRGIKLPESRFILGNQISMIKSDKKIRVFSFHSLMQWLIDTPIIKSKIAHIRFGGANQ